MEGGGTVSGTVSCCQDDEWRPAPAVRALMGAAALYITHTPLCERLLTALKSAAETHKSTQNTPPPFRRRGRTGEDGSSSC